MFTGIVEDLGTVQKITKLGQTLVLSIRSRKICEDIHVGDSIAVNGVCLTVTEFSGDIFKVDVMPETFNSTSLASLQDGSLVNLERAMAANGRFGGHFVSGHVDGVGKIERKERKENAIYIDISFPEEYRHLLLYKGSIAVDGISLTVFGINGNQLTVSIIPHTAKETVLGFKSLGDIVNLEFDLIGKYIHSFFTREEKKEAKKEITAQFLRETGFI